MKTIVALLMLSVTATFAADTNRTVENAFYRIGVSAGPLAYKDRATGIIFYVESDGRHVTALDTDGKILWHRDPFADGKLEFYRTKTPRIVYIGKTNEVGEKCAAAKGQKVIGIAFNCSQFGDLDIKTGNFTFRGQD